MTEHYYSAFGLVFASSVELPSLASASLAGPENPDVRISLGTVAMPEVTTEVMDMRVAAHGDTVVLDVPESGRFMVAGGSRIVVQPDAGAGPAEVQAYLLGSVMGALLHQRSLLPLHCNAIEVNGQAILLCGDSGAGKSTLAAYFSQKGYRLLTDDLCAVRFDAAGAPLAAPGLPRMKLWPESVALMGLGSESARRVPWTEDKVELPVHALATSSLPVAALYHLRERAADRPPGIHRVGTLDALNVVTANIYRRRVADIMGRGVVYLGSAARLVAAAPVFSVNRRWGKRYFLKETALLEAAVLRLAPGAQA